MKRFPTRWLAAYSVVGLTAFLLILQSPTKTAFDIPEVVLAGALEQDRIHVVKIPVTNLGKNTLTVEATGSCSCVIPNISQVPPNQNGIIEILFRAPSEQGDFSEDVLVTDGDLVRRTTIKGMVDSSLQITPRDWISLPEITGSSDYTKKFKISWRKSLGSLQHLKVISPVPFIKVIELGRDKSFAEFQIEVLPSCPSGEFNFGVDVAAVFSGAELSRRILVAGVFDYDSSCNPSVAMIPKVSGQMEFSTSLSSSMKAPLSIEWISGGPSRLVDFEHTFEGNLLTVRFGKSVHPSAITGGSILVRDSEGNDDSLLIPLFNY